jgi:hypothetical protein
VGPKPPRPTHEGWPNGFAWPPFVKLRLSRADEKAAYEDESKDAEIYDDVKVVYLVNIPIVS